MSTGQPSPREYRLQSPGEGVYRVILEDIGTGTAAQAFFTGHDAVETVRLPPGNYMSAITDVGRNLVVSGERITLSDEGGLIPLPQFPEVAPRSSAPPSIAPAGIDTRASTMVSRSSARSTNRPVRRHSLAAKKEYASRPVVPERVPEGVPMGAGRHGLRFDAALSEDIAPGSIGGWRAPTGLRVTGRRMEESGGLSIDVEDDLEVRRSRLRLTIGIEGRPALRIPLPLFRGGVAVSIKPIWTAHGPDVQVEVAAKDVRVQGLLVALGDLNPDEAASVVTWASGTKADAVEVLAQKSQDLWAAATAAIVLTRIGQLEQVADWTHNLTRLAPHIADAGVVAAWATLGFGEGPVEKVERRAIELLQRSARAGAPTFAMGNSLLLEVLANLRVSSIERRSARIADVEYRRATRRSRFRVFRSPLMIWEQAGEQLKGGRLSGSRYASVAHGTLVGQPEASRLILPR